MNNLKKYKDYIYIALISVLVTSLFNIKCNKIEKKEVETQERVITDTIALKLMKGAENYLEASVLLSNYKKVFENNSNIFTNTSADEVFAAFCAIFMSESKDKKINKAGSSVLFRKGYNGTGIKAGSKWKGDVLYTSYWEVKGGIRVNYASTTYIYYIKGKKPYVINNNNKVPIDPELWDLIGTKIIISNGYKIKAKDRINAFRKYNLVEEAIEDWFKLLKKKRYSNTLRSRSAEGIVYNIVKDGYSTAKSYNMWLNILTTYNFKNIYKLKK